MLQQKLLLRGSCHIQSKQVPEIKLRVTFLSLTRLFGVCFALLDARLSRLTGNVVNRSGSGMRTKLVNICPLLHPKILTIKYKVQLFKAIEIQQAELFPGLLSLFLFNLISAICHGSSEGD